MLCSELFPTGIVEIRNVTFLLHTIDLLSFDSAVNYGIHDRLLRIFLKLNNFRTFFVTASAKHLRGG